MFFESRIGSQYLGAFGMVCLGVSNRFWRPIVLWHVDAVLRSRSMIIFNQYKVNIYLRKALTFLQLASIDSAAYCLFIETDDFWRGACYNFLERFLRRSSVFLLSAWHPGAFTNSVLTRWHFTHTLALEGPLDHYYPHKLPDVAVVGNSVKDNAALGELNTFSVPVVGLVSPRMEFYGQSITYPVFADSSVLSVRMFFYKLCAKAWTEGYRSSFYLYPLIDPELLEQVTTDDGKNEVARYLKLPYDGLQVNFLRFFRVIRNGAFKKTIVKKGVKCFRHYPRVIVD